MGRKITLKKFKSPHCQIQLKRKIKQESPSITTTTASYAKENMNLTIIAVKKHLKALITTQKTDSNILQ